jgi:glutathione S-transferase
MPHPSSKASRCSLYYRNKNYSSCRCDPGCWIPKSAFPFEEVCLRLDWETRSLPFKKNAAELAPTGRVPLLIDEGFAVWDTLAIVEYLADKFPDQRIWP